ncbi:MAG: T9SS type A sorting domain-containing protein [Bacteroidetes bacterium]|nr:T9SS type A sorting domain-containing protein [Bacteroidota bacterium]
MIRYIFILVGLLLLSGNPAIGQDGAPENLTAELTNDGFVLLKWNTPGGQLPSRYEVWRGHVSPDLVVAQIYSPTAVQFTDYTVTPGDEYVYMVVAVHSGPRYGRAFTSIRVLQPPNGLSFTSDPITTALVGEEYFYTPTVDTPNPTDVAYSLVGTVPDGMTVNFVVGGTYYVHWHATEVGVHPVTLEARNTQTGARAIQEFTINVASEAGTLRGFVKSITNEPLPGTTMRFWQVSKSSNMTYEVRTDQNGEFLLENVQVGRIYAYAESPNDQYQSQWYINASSIQHALERVLDTGNNDTLTYEFYLFAAIGTPAPVTGRVVNELGAPVTGARISFVRKNDFIRIGDTTSLNLTAPESHSHWRRDIIDTTVHTDFNGRFTVRLPVGREYYTIVEKQDYLTTFNGAETNAMHAKSIRIHNTNNLNYILATAGTTSNTLYGKVISESTGVSKIATVVLIDSELKRGAGGGHTYRKYHSVVTDSNGVFAFDNLPDSPPSALLAIPVDPTLAPQYYHSSGGRTNFTESEELSPLGTIQDINFRLQQTKRSGIGSYYGQVLLRRGAERIPVPGTIVFAEDEHSGAIKGYAITDSTGWYSITGLQPGNYLLHADNPNYSYPVFYSPATPTKSMPATMNYVNSVDLNKNVQVDFYIDDLRFPVGIKEHQPGVVTLAQNYPNPFNPSTTIRFSIPQRRHVTLRVFNPLGTLVTTLIDAVVDAGQHSVPFTAEKLTSGVYFYQLQTEGSTLSKTMILVK